MENISNFIVVHRRLSCEDESASDEELCEKILFYYPNTLTTIEKLIKLGLVEGLIEFTSKLGDENVDYIVMESKLWVFYECEPQLWIISSLLYNNGTRSNQCVTERLIQHRPCGTSLKAVLKRMYETFVLFHGSMYSAISGGVDGLGWEIVRQVQALRAKIRKLKRRLDQELRDVEYFQRKDETATTCEIVAEKADKGSHGDNYVKSITEPEPGLGLNDKRLSAEILKARVDGTNSEILQQRELLDRLQCIEPQSVSSSDGSLYTLPSVRAKLEQFLHWYLGSGELQSVSSLSQLASGVEMADLPPHVALSLKAVRLAVIGLSHTGDYGMQRISGLQLLWDGKLVWSDLSAYDSYLLADSLRLMENAFQRRLWERSGPLSEWVDVAQQGLTTDAASQQLPLSPQGRSSSASLARRGSMRERFSQAMSGLLTLSPQSAGKADPQQSTLEYNHSLNSVAGFVTNAYSGYAKSVAETETAANLFVIPAVEGENGPAGSDSSSVREPEVWCPTLRLASGNDADNSSTRVIVYRQSPFLVSLLVESANRTSDSSSQSSLQYGVYKRLLVAAQQRLGQALLRFREELSVAPAQEIGYAASSAQLHASPQLPNSGSAVPPFRIVCRNADSHAAKTNGLCPPHSGRLGPYPTVAYREPAMLWPSLIASPSALAQYFGGGAGRGRQSMGFPASAGLLSACTDSSTLKALNEAHRLLDATARRLDMRSVREVGMRVAGSESLWLLGHRQGSRCVLLAVEHEGDSVTEVHASVRRLFDVIFRKILM